MSITQDKRNFLSLYALAWLFWILIFVFKFINSWLGVSLSTILLVIFSIKINGNPLKKGDISLNNFLKGALSAIVLYLCFFVGNAITTYLFPALVADISEIFTEQSLLELTIICFVLLFITSPAEELFWRGYIQAKSVAFYGLLKGNILSAVLYGAIHLCIGNSMLALAALVSGFFWSILYSYTKNIFICIVSHGLWAVLGLAIFPLAG